MSVSNPVDSGGMGLNSFDRDLQGFAEKLNTVGGWAELMAEDSKNNTFEEEESKRKEEVIEEDDYDDIKAVPPYVLQLVLPTTNKYDPDELYFFFGGDDKVDDMIIKEHGRILITFKYKEDYAKYHRKKTIHFNSFVIRAFTIGNNNRELPSYSRQGSYQQQPQRESYSRQGSFHGSTHSLASHQGDRRQEYDRRNDRYDNRRDYNTMPPSGYRDDRGGRGGYKGGRNRGGYSRSQYDGPGEIQRSGSYTYDGNRPAPINRSRTDDSLADRRQSGVMSRTSSQYSVNTEGERIVAKKPSTKDLFGDAKPVDTDKRLKDIEEKMEKKKQADAEKAEKEKKERLQQQQPQPTQPTQPQASPQASPASMCYSFPGHPHPGIYSHPPPTYYTSYPPQYATPIVNMGPGGIHSPQHMQTPPPMYPSNNNQPFRGEVKIIQRNSAERDGGANASPPLDPEHPRQPMERPPVSHPIETIKEEPSPLPPRRVSQDGKLDGQDKQGKQFNRTRTFQNSSHRGCFDGNRGNLRGRGGPRGGGRGGHAAAQKTDSAPNQPAAEALKTENSSTTTQLADNKLNKDNRVKDHHGSHASLSSRAGRGGGRGRGGGGRSGGFYNKDNKDRPHKAEGQRPPQNEQKPKQGDGSKEHQKPHQQRKFSKEDEQKSQNTTITPVKAEAKKEIPKEETAPAVTKTEPAPTTPTADAKEKKKEKKKKSAAKNATPLNGNKFAALQYAEAE